MYRMASVWQEDVLLTVADILRTASGRQQNVLRFLTSMINAQLKSSLEYLTLRLSHEIFMGVCTVAETPICFMFVRLSVGHDQCGFHWRDFCVNFVLKTWMKILPDSPNVVVVRQKYVALYMKTSVHFFYYRQHCSCIKSVSLTEVDFVSVTWCIISIQKRHYCTLYSTFPNLFHSTDKLWPCNITIFINCKLYLNGCYVCHQTAWHRLSV